MYAVMNDEKRLIGCCFLSGQCGTLADEILLTARLANVGWL